MITIDDYLYDRNSHTVTDLSSCVRITRDGYVVRVDSNDAAPYHYELWSYKHFREVIDNDWSEFRDKVKPHLEFIRGTYVPEFVPPTPATDEELQQGEAYYNYLCSMVMDPTAFRTEMSAFSGRNSNRLFVHVNDDHHLRRMLMLMIGKQASRIVVPAQIKEHNKWLDTCRLICVATLDIEAQRKLQLYDNLVSIVYASPDDPVIDRATTIVFKDEPYSFNATVDDIGLARGLWTFIHRKLNRDPCLQCLFDEGAAFPTSIAADKVRIKLKDLTNLCSRHGLEYSTRDGVRDHFRDLGFDYLVFRNVQTIECSYAMYADLLQQYRG